MLNTIDQAGNASDGLSYLDVTFSVGLTIDQALTDARDIYADARLATAMEFDDLFQAAGIIYNDPSLTAASGFDTGQTLRLSTGSNYDGGALQQIIGITFNGGGGILTNIFTDPDGTESDSSSRDIITLQDTDVTSSQSQLVPGPASGNTTGWLIVVGPTTGVVPEPTSLFCWLGAALIGLTRRRRNQQRCFPTQS